MEAALGALCRGGGWSYAAVWRFHPHDPRLLTLGESYCEDEARTVFEKMLTQVHIVGEGIIGEAAVSGNCKWIFNDAWHALNQTNPADNRDSFQDHTWWQQQFLNGIKTIAILPLQLQGMVQFGSFRKVLRNSDFLNQVRYIFLQMNEASRDHPMVYTQIDSVSYGQQTTLNSLGSANDILVQNKANPLQNEKLEENINRSESLRSSIYSPINSNESQGSGNTTISTYVPTLPANESICEIKEFDNVTGFLYQQVDVTTPFQVTSRRELMSVYKHLNSLHGTEKESSGQNKPEYPAYHHSTTDVPPNSGPDELCHPGAGFSSSFTPDPRECTSLFSPGESFIIQNDLMQLKDATQFTCQGSGAFPELPNRTPEEAIEGTSDDGIKECDVNNGLLESIMLDLSTNNFVQDWWDGNVLQAGNLPDLGDTHSESVRELANKHSQSTGDSGFPAISVIEQLLGGGAHKPAGQFPLVMKANAACGVSEHLPQFDLGDGVASYTAQVPSLACGSHIFRNAQNGSSKATSMPPADVSVDDSCSLNTANSKGSQSNNPEGTKVPKKRARAGESTRPRPKDRQLIQDRVKELREMVPNGAKCSIDALLDRTIKHMLFLQSVTKYAEKIKQADEPKMIDKESGVILRGSPNAGKGGATWSYEVAGKTMVCPIIIEDLSPPGQMLVEMLCEEREFFLEIADSIRGFGLTILKGLMEARDGKIWARFLVEANRDVTRMDIFLSLVQLLEQNSLVGSTDQVAKVMNNGVPSFADHERSPLPIPVGISERLQ